MNLHGKLPKWVFIQLLEGCNLRCKMCYEWGGNGSYHKKKDLAVLDPEAIVRIIRECREIRPHYEIFGGEPLLYPYLYEVLSEIREGGSTVDIPTNGTLLADKAELLVDTEVSKLWISLDGPREVNDKQRGPGVFDKVMAGIGRVHEIKMQKNAALPKLGIGTVVTPRNYRMLAALFKEELDLSMLSHVSLELQSYITKEEHEAYRTILSEQFGIEDAPISKGLTADPAEFETMDFHFLAGEIEEIAALCEAHGITLNRNPKDMSEENLRAYFSGRWDKLRGARERCPFPWISAEVNARGDVTTCHALYDMVLGSIYQNSLEEIWNGEAYEKFRSFARRSIFPVCHACCLYYNQKLNFGE